jgi:hypothetical protein
MRRRLVSLVAALCLCAAASAQAEQRMFVIANDASGYGVDRCLASGAECGVMVANAYCRAQQFAQARAFRAVDRNDITGAIPNGGSPDCRGNDCTHFVAITCTR